MSTHRKASVPFALLAGLLVTSSPAFAFNEVKVCGTNLKCRIVDVLDRGPGPAYNVFPSAFRVEQAWNKLLSEAGCQDVADVVVGGTFGENGSPGSSTPAGFAEHVKNRCALVVHYELETLTIDAQDYDNSVEHGRKALAVVMNKLDALRAAAGKTTRLRVWGHSKGASIVESTWRMEARNDNTKFITTLNGVDTYVDACPRDNCYYFGFGYPYEQERTSGYSISRAAASTWLGTVPGNLAKAPAANAEWWRLTTFSNMSDPIYSCDRSCAFALAFNSHCHRYEQFLSAFGYSYFDSFNTFTSSSTRPAPAFFGDQCGEVGNTGTFELSPADVTVAPRERVTLALEWTVPDGGWRVLKELHLRVRDGGRIALWVRFEEATGELSVFQEQIDGFGGFGSGREPGSREVLSTPAATLYLDGSAVHAAGPAASTVTLELEISFKESAAGLPLLVEVSANDDLGNTENFRPAGTLTVTGAPHGR